MILTIDDLIAEQYRRVFGVFGGQQLIAMSETPAEAAKTPLTLAEDKVSAALESWDAGEKLIALKLLRHVYLPYQSTHHDDLSRAIRKALPK